MDGVSDEDLFDFPCDFPVKIMGANSSEFREQAARIVRRYFPEFNSSPRENISRNKSFVSLTFTLHATSKAELDALYLALDEEASVLMVL